LLALLRAHHILHVSTIRVKLVPEVCSSLTAVGSDASEEVSRPPARADQLKIFILNHEDRPSIAE